MEATTNVNCPVAATLHLIGGKYKALLLWHLSGCTSSAANTKRFCCGIYRGAYCVSAGCGN